MGQLKRSIAWLVCSLGVSACGAAHHDADASKPTDPECAEAVLQREPIDVKTQAELDALPLVSGAGDIQIQGPITNLARFKCLVHADHIAIVDTPLGDLTGLGRLQRVDVLEIGENESLQSLDGLSSLRDVTEIRLVVDPLLTDIDALEEVTALDQLIFDQIGVTSLAAFDKLSSVRQVSLSEMPIADLTGLEHATLNELYLNDDPNLTSLAGFNPANTALGALEMYRNSAFDDLSALSALESATGSVLLFGNGALSSLAGLEKLRNVSALDVTNNPNLTSITALQSLSSVSVELSISGNASLPTCQAQALADRVEPPRADLSGNLESETCD